MKKEETIAKLKQALESATEPSLRKEIEEKINKLSNDNTVEK